MALILSIDTSIDKAIVCLSLEGKIIAIEKSNDIKNHGAFLQPAIKNILENTNTNINSLDAIAVANGPGSYTGLRVALSSAKGLCYALNKPLITINTLEVLALASIMSFETNEKETFEQYLFCPMIDARRMEVFTAVYNNSLQLINEPTALVLDSNSFKELLNNNKIVFSGNGSLKFSTIMTNSNAYFNSCTDSGNALAALSFKYFAAKLFADVSYSEPFYIKDVFIIGNSKQE